MPPPPCPSPGVSPDTFWVWFAGEITPAQPPGCPLRCLCVCSNFYGQMTAVYILDEALTLPQAQQLHTLGPNYIGAFSPVDCPPHPDMGLLFDGDFASRIILAFSPLARGGHVLYNLSAACQALRRLPEPVGLNGMLTLLWR